MTTRTPESRALGLCGGCTLDGEPVQAGGRLLVLLVILGLRGARGVSREELALWPEGEAVDTKAFDPLLSRLRRIVGPVSGRGHVRLDPALVAVDVHTPGLAALAEVRSGGEAQLAAEAVRLLGGDLVPGCAHPCVEAERLTLRERRAEALELVARSGLPAGAGPEALADGVAAARALIALSPYSERATAVLKGVQPRYG